MSTNPFTEAACAEAERRHIPLDRPTAIAEQCAVQGFRDGAAWARDHLAAQESTGAEQRARFSVESMHQIHGTHCVCGFVSDRARSRTEHIMTHYFDALSAARAARREEDA